MSFQRVCFGIEFPRIPQSLIRPVAMSAVRRWEDLSERERQTQAASFRDAWDPSNPQKITSHPWFPVLGNLSIGELYEFDDED